MKLKALEPFLNKIVSLKQLELITLDLPQKEVFQSAIGIRKSREALIVKWTDADGNTGYGESSARPDPYYSSEFMSASIELIERFIFPQLQATQTYAQLLRKLEKVRGWKFTKSTLEFAAHDIIRKREGVTLFDYWKRPSLERLPVGISLGLQPDGNAMLRAIANGQKAGYHRLKFKISPQSNLELFRMLLDNAGDSFISFDANGTFYPEDFEQLHFFYQHFPNAIEQPFPPGRIDIVQAAKRVMPNLKVCFDEEVKSIGDLMKVHQLGVTDELNIKLGRVGGLFASIQMAEYCFENGVPAWVGGMFETGIGRSLNIQFAARLLGAQAHDLSPSDRYFLEDILQNPITMDEEGYVEVASAKNAAVNENTLEKYITARKVLTL